MTLFITDGGDAEHAQLTHRGLLTQLTRREADVLRLVARGMTDRQIAATLYISRKTASNHVHNILRKAGVSTRTGAVGFAVRAGLP